MEISKRITDLAISIPLIIFFSPLVVIISLLIKLTSKGPVLLKEERVGKNSVPFAIYKFRTSTHRISDDHREELIKNQLSSPVARRKKQKTHVGEERRKTVFTIENGKNLTKIGSFLKNTGLERFPQLFNVLLGDMSLVGPRPPVPYEIPYHTQEDLKRLDVIPGITGLWQISTRDQMNYREMIMLDLEYVRKRGWLYDIKILFKSLGKVKLLNYEKNN